MSLKIKYYIKNLKFGLGFSKPFHQLLLLFTVRGNQFLKNKMKQKFTIRWNKNKTIVRDTDNKMW